MKLVFLLMFMLLLAQVAGARSAPKAGGFFFVQLADPQLGFSTKDTDLSVDIQRFQIAVDAINRLKPAFVLISGDLINKPHDPTQIRAFWKVTHEIDPRIPVHLVAGNHDIDVPDQRTVGRYERLFGKDHYAFAYGGSQFIVLDTCLIREATADGALRDAQRKWLEQELKDARGANQIFVLTHHSWFLNDPAEADRYFTVPTAQRVQYLDLMKRYGADWAVAGHYHRNAVARDGDINMITTSAVCHPLGDGQAGIRIFKVYPDHVEHAFYTLDKLPAEVKL